MRRSNRLAPNRRTVVRTSRRFVRQTAPAQLPAQVVGNYGLVGSRVTDLNFGLHPLGKTEDGVCDRAMNGDLVCRLGADVSGTFTDVVLRTGDGCLVTRKVLSTSAEAIFTGIADVLQEAGIAGRHVKELIHGTTVATNALIERRGASADRFGA